MTDTYLRVVKVGGSLLAWEGLPAALQRWLSEQPRARTILTAGGGALADVIRRADERFGLHPADAHWICVSLLAASARLLAALLPSSRLMTRFADLQDELIASPESLLVFSVEDFLRGEDLNSGRTSLPQDWRTTSDSIAARLAEAVGADELVLLKSRDLPPTRDWTSAAAAGLVDEYFPVAAADLAVVRWVNLRDLAQHESGLRGTAAT